MNAQYILKMIEEVDPSDTAKLGEIDARVTAYIEFSDFSFDPRGFWLVSSRLNGMPTAYTRSRDALKTIRPEGWENISVEGGAWFTFCLGKGPTNHHPYVRGHGKYHGLPTEELAELHAIIQAIDFERKK